MCIPGDRSDELAPGERWSLFLSAVLEKDSGSACSSALRGGSVCFTPASSGTTTCVPISDPCAHNARASSSIAVSTEDLIRDPLRIEIKWGTGVTIASRGGPLYSRGLQRSAVCIGAKVGGFTNVAGGNVDSLTFFLAPQGSALPPAPPTPPTGSTYCQECTFNGRCQPLADGRIKKPCCEPIRSVLGNNDPTEVARCQAAWETTLDALAHEPPCRQCLGKAPNGTSCMLLEGMGNADPRACCEKIPVGVPTCGR